MTSLTRIFLVYFASLQGTRSVRGLDVVMKMFNMIGLTVDYRISSLRAKKLRVFQHLRKYEAIVSIIHQCTLSLS